MTATRCNHRILLALLVLLAGDVARADSAGDQFAVAAGHYREERWELALGEFKKFVADFPTHPKADQAQFYVGETLVQLRRFAEAGDQFEAFLKRQPDEPLARKAAFRAGEANYFAGRLDIANRLLSSFVDQHPQDKLNAYALAYLGDAALEKGPAADAEQWYRRSLTEFADGPLAVDCRFGLARAVEQQGRNDEALGMYRTLASAASGQWSAEAAYRIGRVELAAGHFEAAAAAYGAVTAAVPESHALQGQARLGRGQALYQLKRYDEATVVLKDLVGKPNVNVEAGYWLGLTQRANGDALGAAKMLAALAAENQQHPLAPTITYQAGDAYLRAGKPNEARAQFELLVSHWPKHELADDALIGKMRVALSLDDTSAVEAAGAQFSKLFPGSPLARDAKRLEARSLLMHEKFAPAAELLAPLVTGAKSGNGEGLEDRYLLALAQQGEQKTDLALRTLEPVLTAPDAQLRSNAVRLAAAAKLAQKKYAEVIAMLDEYLQSNPPADAAAHAQAELAVCYAQLKKFDQARKAYTAFAARAKSPKLTLPVVDVLAEAALAGRQFDWAGELFALLVQSGTPEQQARGLAGLGWSRFEAGNEPGALEAFTELTTKHADAPAAGEAAWMRGQLLAHGPQYEATLAAYKLVIDRYPKNAHLPQAILQAARLEEQLDHKAEAAALYERVIREFPKLEERDMAMYNRAWVLRDLGKTDESDKQFEDLRNIYADSRYWPDAVYRLAESLVEKQKFDDARKLLTQLLERGPGERVLTHAMYLSAQCSIGQEQWAEARAPLERLLRDFPNDELRPLAEYWLAESLYRAGEYDQASKRFDALAEKLPAKREPWMAMITLRRSQIFVQRKKWPEAFALADELNRSMPDFEQCHEVDYVLGRCLSNQGKFDEAREAYGRVVRSKIGAKSETAAMAQWMIGESYFHQKAYEAAIREYLRLEILYAYPTWQAGALLQAGKCHEALGEWTQAVELYARLLKNYPNNSFCDEATRRLQTAQRRVASK